MTGPTEGVGVQPITVFRGTSGEVVRLFVSLPTLATLAPVVVVDLVLMFTFGFLAEHAHLPPSLGIITVMVVSSAITGRFALAAREGDLEAGFFTERVSWSESFAFAGRYIALVLTWGIPLTLMARGVAPTGGDFDPNLLTLLLSPVAGWHGIALLLLGIIGLCLNALSLLVATRVDRLADAYKIEPWRWATTERRADLSSFFSAIIGGWVVFCVMAAPLLLALTLAAAHLSVKLLLVVGALSYTTVIAAAVVLWGRLCGAFAGGDGTFAHQAPVEYGEGAGATAPPVIVAAAMARARAEASDDPPIAGAAATAGTAATAAPSPEAASIQAARRLPAAQALDQVRLKAGTDLPGAIRDAEILRQAHAANPNVAVELSRLYQRAGQIDDARRAAADAIRVALSAGTGPVAADLFVSFGADRDKLGLDLPTVEQLGRVLLSRSQLNDALWCFRTLSLNGGDPARTQKGLIAVAEAAVKGGKAAGAIQIYEHVLKTYPDSTFRDFVEAALAKLKT